MISRTRKKRIFGRSPTPTGKARRFGEPYSAQVADIGEALIAENVADPETTVQIIVCTPADDPCTITLPHPIKHDRDGVWTAQQRYVSSDALRAGVTTTTELEEVNHTTMTTAPIALAMSLASSDLRVVAFKLNLEQWAWERMSVDAHYERTRYAWRTSPLRHNPDYAFAVPHGIVRAVFRIHRWEQITATRWAFHGELDHELTSSGPASTCPTKWVRERTPSGTSTASCLRPAEREPACEGRYFFAGPHTGSTRCYSATC